MHLVFDLGAVIFTFEPLRIVTEIFPQLARDADQAAALSRRIFGPEWLRFDRGIVTAEALVPQLAGVTGLPPSELERVVDAVRDRLVPMPATLALLPRLRERGHRLFYLSNMPGPYAVKLREDSDVLLRFDDGLFSSDVQLVKPEAAIYRAAEQRFDMRAGDAVFIDDSQANVDAARAAGWDAFRFDDAAQCEAELTARGLL